MWSSYRAFNHLIILSLENKKDKTKASMYYLYIDALTLISDRGVWTIYKNANFSFNYFVVMYFERGILNA